MAPAPPAAGDTSADSPSNGEPPLRRVMGPKLLLLFILGDILGTGVFALTGQVAAEVGGAAWVPFLVAFLVATITAFSYLELVTKYPQAAGAALYTHKAFGIHFVTFLVAFVVMSSGITSASTAIAVLGGATALLAVFAVVNVAVLILRRDPPPEGAFRAPSALPVIGAIACPSW